MKLDSVQIQNNAIVKYNPWIALLSFSYYMVISSIARKGLQLIVCDG